METFCYMKGALRHHESQRVSH
ncbi:hypothetical protein CB082_20025 [Salmonella enterica subsp. enterica serovar Altona]|uniref:Uncharacterized protein n=3 Tax=Salmonella enterica TaxID=28901 RepID=A0A5Y2QIT0_SALER|nr:hypothetical protein [Salmonella enterica]EBD0023530.1 hypothetical protein [Salmonella enterica subsp. enterica serovar Altona]EBF8127603.1 hypothetical protein [Salmonella enterica subsp. enterica]EBG5205421.1 hypothetical protein [Salmonella enterica subsp. enterica serovar Geraldton]EBP3214861.1 hypothetical protein [Salmonella enterica subsp. arizonae]ECA8971305.1 hypothetical protein [Salmonella enterica subsp. enterica serovar Omuna]ECB1960430.1 hypothetical protein [Salmonella ente